MSSFRQAHTLFRLTGSYVDGDWVEASEASISITASIQPATGNDLQNVPEGRRASGVFAVFTDTAIQTAVQGATPTKADRLSIGGILHEAVHVEPWQNNVINHYKALFARIG